MKAGRAWVIVFGLVALHIRLAPSCAAAQRSETDSMPTIVTYELSKARKDAHTIARDPKGFWISEIVTRIEDRKSINRVAIKTPKTVEVGFVIDRGGHLVSKEVARSSGDAALDKQALSVLERAAPFPPMPAGVTDDHLAFTVPLRFR